MHPYFRVNTHTPAQCFSIQLYSRVYRLTKTCAQLTMYSHMIIMYVHTKEKRRHTHIHTGRNTPIHPHTCCSSSSTAPCVNGWESNYYSHTGTTFCHTCLLGHVCMCVSGSGGVSDCQHRAHTHCSLADFLSSSHFAFCMTVLHRHTQHYIQNTVKHSAVFSSTSKHVGAA